ncbi:3,4-dihydroxy-2-butanone-4-phosphate synthase [Amycolatopsis sp. cmx-4-68]|uniref:3,4-dihydroxy-2-butanone-4-phosphate synthase n=1 Tax=Amycolatopsis sp. cmx-4-68 TaxID=2790938 RepID=UPI00397C44F1
MSTSADVTAVSAAVAQLARAHPVVLVDEAGVVLVHAAATITTEAMAFIVKHTSGLVYVALTASRCAQLRLPPMWPFGDPSAPDHCVTFDAREGTTTGISAHDRAVGAKLLARSDTTHADLLRPGHLIPIRAADGPVLARAGRPETAIRLVELAGLPPVAVLAEVVSTQEPTRMCTEAEGRQFATEHGLAALSPADVVRHECDLLAQLVGSPGDLGAHGGQPFQRTVIPRPERDN